MTSQSAESESLVLQEAIDGLDSLDWGETPDIFALGKKGRWGKHPAVAKRFAIKAAGYVEVLKQREKLTKEAAVEKVLAEQFGIEANTLRQWIKGFNKDDDQRVKRTIHDMAFVYRPNVKLVFPVSLDELSWNELKADGVKFRGAHDSKIR